MDADSIISQLVYDDIGVFKDLGFLWPTVNKKMIVYSAVYFPTLAYYYVTFIVSFCFLLDDMHVLFLNINFFMLLSLAVSLPLLMKLSRKEQTTALLMVHEGFFQYKIPLPTSVSRETRERVAKEIYVFAIVLLSSMGSATVILFSPTIDSYFGDVPNKTSDYIAYNLPIHLWVPFKLHHSFWGEIVFLVGESLVVFFIAVTILATELLYIKICQRVFYEQELLIWSLENIMERVQIGVKESQENSDFWIDYCLTENIKHHQRIKIITGFFNRIISPMLMSAWCLGTTTIALSLYEAVQGDISFGKILVSGSLTVAEVLNVFVLSRMGQHIVDLGEGIDVAVRFLPWYTFLAGTKRNYLILLSGTKEPEVLKAGRMIAMNYDSFATAMNTAYSYFNFLRAA